MKKNVAANTAKQFWQLRQRRAPLPYYVTQGSNSQMLISFVLVHVALA